MFDALFNSIAAGFGGGFAAEGGPVAHAWKVPNISRVLVFKLGAQEQLPPIVDHQRALAKPEPVSVNADVVEQGKVVFQRHCSYCHGDGFRTGVVTPDLRYSGEAIHNMWDHIVLDGILSGAGMVSFAEFVSKDESEAIRQYVLSEANRLYDERQVAPQSFESKKCKRQV